MTISIVRKKRAREGYKLLDVFIPTKGRYRTISSHKVFPTAKIIVHNGIEKDRYIKYGIDPRRVIVSNVKSDKFGLTRQREWVCQNLAGENKWFVFADDNIHYLTAVHKSLYYTDDLPVQEDKSLRERFMTNILAGEGGRFWEIANDTIKYAESVKARMCGFAVVDNFYFRGKKFRKYAYVIGKLMLMKNHNLTWDHTISMEDFRNTADHLLRFGAVTVNNYLFPVAGHYEKGGMGTYKQRVPIRKQDVRKLMSLYRGLFRIRNRKGFESNTDLSLRLHTDTGINKWRKETVSRIRESRLRKG